MTDHRLPIHHSTAAMIRLRRSETGPRWQRTVGRGHRAARRWRGVLSFVVGLGLAFNALETAGAFPEDTAPTFANGGADPSRTIDPVAVEGAQSALAAFFDYTNLSYSVKGFANPWQMREELGNDQGNWLDMVMPLACGRLVDGYKFMNWVPGKGWTHDAAPKPLGQVESVACEYSAPSPGRGGPEPSQTTDPVGVAAAQKALAGFYAFTNLSYSLEGYANPWLMREDFGNSQSDWLNMTLPLARGRLVGGYRGMNWVPGKGWCNCAAPGGGTVQAAGPGLPGAQAADGTFLQLNPAVAPAHDEAATPPHPQRGRVRRNVDDPMAARIKASFKVSAEEDER